MEYKELIMYYDFLVAGCYKPIMTLTLSFRPKGEFYGGN